MLLRTNWQRLFQSALALLKASTNPVDRTTWQILTRKKVNGKKIQILPFTHLSQAEYAILARDYFNEAKIKLPNLYPPSNEILKKMGRKWGAVLISNYIFIEPSEIKTPEKFKKILVHEANHFLNDSENHNVTASDRFREELRGFLAEKISKGGPITRLFVKKRAQKIARNYNLPLPDKIQYPKGIFFVDDSPAFKKLR